MVTIQPFGSSVVHSVRLLGSPQMSYSIFGGMEAADVPCVLPQDLAARVRLARVVVGGPEPFIGVAWRYTPGEGLHVLGPGCWASMQVREAPYLRTGFSDFAATKNVGASKTIGISVDEAAISFSVAKDTAVNTAEWHRAYRYHPMPAATRVVYVWSRPSNRERIRLMTGVDGGGTQTEPITWTAVDTIASGSGALSGTNTVDIAGAYSYLAVTVTVDTGHTPGADEAVQITDMKVYGVPTVTSATAGNVLTEHLSKAPTWALPAGAAYRAHVGAPAGEIAPLWFPIETEEVAIPAEVIRYAAWDYGYYPARVGQAWYGLPHYLQRETTPSYRIDVRRCLEPVAFEADMEPLASKVRVLFTDWAGRSRYYDKADADTTHELVKRGIVKTQVIRAEVSNAAGAEVVAALYLADAGRDQVNETLKVDAVYTLSGARVPLRCVRPGRLVRLTGIGRRPVDAVLRRLSTDDATASLAVDNTPYRLETELARLDKRKASWSEV